MLPNKIKALLSKYNNLPRRSILFAFCFFVGFLALNLYSYQQNSKRLELIENLSYNNLSYSLIDIEENLRKLDALIDSENLSVTDKEKKFDAQMDAIRNKLLSLQDNFTKIDDISDSEQHFVSIYGILDGMEEFKKKNGLGDDKLNTRLMNFLHSASEHFYQINATGQNYTQRRFNSILAELRRDEGNLMLIGVGFVLLGSVMILFLMVDLFKRGELLDKATQAERLKNSFFAMMSHEIRTPINGILGTVNMMYDTSLDPHQKHLAEIVHSSAESLLVIVNDVLDYSKIEAGKLEIESSDFNLKDMLESIFDLVRPLAAAKKLDVSYTLGPDVKTALHSDPSRIRQILLNFLSNAIKFTEKGCVRLDIFVEPLFNKNDPQPFINFEVIDTGMGISEEAKTRLFREFSQVDGSYARRFAGTGLGLAICRRLVEMMGGFIGVESEIGRGSTFWFSLPMIEAKEAIIERSAVKFNPAMLAAPSNVLLVEDNMTNQMIALSFLNHGKHNTDTAVNGKEAVEAVSKKNYDVVLMDIAMPEMDGFAATRAIRDMGGDYKKLPIIAMTAHAMRGDREECLRNGMDDYITKPLSKEGLLQMVAKWTPQKAAAEQPEIEAKPEIKPVITEEKKTDLSSSEPEISELHLQQIMNDLGVESFGGFAKVFLDDLKETGAAMLNSEKTQDWQSLKTYAHSLKSSSLSFGLIRLSRFAASIEMECKTSGKPNPKLLVEWPDRVETALAALNERFKELNVPALE